MEGGFGKLGRFAHQVHRHANARAAFEIGTEGDVLFRRNSESMIEQADGSRRTDGTHHRGNDRLNGANDDIPEPATNLPGLALDPRGLVIDSAMQQPFEILEAVKRRVDWYRQRYRVFDPGRHGTPPIQWARLCTHSKWKARLVRERVVRSAMDRNRIALLHIQQPAFEIKTATITAQRAARRDHPMAGHDDRDRIPVVGHANGAASQWASNGACNFQVAARLTIRNFQERVPACKLELRPTQIEGKGKLAALTREIFFKFAEVGLKGRLRLLQLNRIRLQLLHPSFEFQPHQSLGGGGEK